MRPRGSRPIAVRDGSQDWLHDPASVLRSFPCTGPCSSCFPCFLRADAAKPTASIEGTIAEGGVVIAGALVAAIASQSQDAAATARSDAQGRFRIGALAPGKYGVTATAAGHTAGLTLNVAAAAGGTAHADVKLGGEAIEVAGSIADDLTGQPLMPASSGSVRRRTERGSSFSSSTDSWSGWSASAASPSLPSRR